MSAIPAWVGPIIGVIVGFSLNIIREYLHEMRFTPVLKIDCTSAPRKIGGVNNPNQKDVYMKFRVQNTRPGTIARNCRAYLIGLHEVRGTRVMEEDVKPDSVQLPWEGGDFEPRDIPSGHSQYGDLVHFSKSAEDTDWIFWSKPNYIGRKSYQGTYQFVVLVSADSIKSTKSRINVDYSAGLKNATPYDA